MLTRHTTCVSDVPAITHSLGIQLANNEMILAAGASRCHRLIMDTYTKNAYFKKFVTLAKVQKT